MLFYILIYLSSSKSRQRQEDEMNCWHLEKQEKCGCCSGRTPASTQAGGRVINHVGHSSKDDTEATQGHLTQCWQEDQALNVPESMKESLNPLLEFTDSLSGESSLCVSYLEPELRLFTAQILHNATQRAATENMEAKRDIFISQRSIREEETGRTRSCRSFTYVEGEEEVAAQFLQEDTLLDLRTRWRTDNSLRGSYRQLKLSKWNLFVVFVLGAI